MRRREFSGHFHAVPVFQCASRRAERTPTRSDFRRPAETSLQLAETDSMKCKRTGKVADLHRVGGPGPWSVPEVQLKSRWLMRESHRITFMEGE